MSGWENPAVSGEALLRRWAEEDRAAVQPEMPQQGGTEAPTLRLSDEDIHRVAQALCRRLLAAAGNM